MTVKLYMENPYLREIESRVVEKKYLDGKYYIKLNRTIFYPNLSGGQPKDRGTISGIEVIDCYEENGDIIHVMMKNVQSDKVYLSIDWEHRLDLMQQHTGQHLLSSCFSKLFNGETTGFYIGENNVYIDIALQKINQDDIQKVEDFANRIIHSNFTIKSYYIEEQDIDKIPLSKVPESHSNVRIVEIDNIDYSPCTGTHLGSTGELGLIKINNVEEYKNYIRVEFFCGSRALKDYILKNKYIKDLTNFLSVPEEDLLLTVTNMYEELNNRG